MILMPELNYFLVGESLGKTLTIIVMRKKTYFPLILQDWSMDKILAAIYYVKLRGMTHPHVSGINGNNWNNKPEDIMSGI